MPELLIASENKGKLEELVVLLSDLPLRLITPAMLGLNLNVVEDGRTYAENAARKAAAYARASGMIALGDDSGLEVEALGGEPGLYSARYLPRAGATDSDRRTFLLEKLRDKPHPWTARFHATIAVAASPEDIRFAEGECRGMIVAEERGTNGFGYDPIFLLPELGRTMAELSMDEKNRLSHRARAIRNARGILVEMLGLDRDGYSPGR